MKIYAVLLITMGCSFAGIVSDYSPNDTNSDVKNVSVSQKLAKFEQLPTNSDVAKRKLLELMRLASSLPEEVRPSVVRAVAAGLISIGANAEYQKVKPKIPDVLEFQDSLLDDCPSCGRNGTSSSQCYDCHGTGRCPIPGCDNGRRVIPDLVHGQRTITCSTCAGSGQCPKCGGAGHFSGKCKTCGGSGKRINKDKAKRIYSESLDNAIHYEEIKAKEAAEREKAEREARERREKEAAERAAAEEFARKQRAKGLVEYKGEWMTPEEMETKRKSDRLADLIVGKSLQAVRFKVFQVFDDGKALCSPMVWTGRRYEESNEVFCLLFPADENRDIVDGDVFTNDLWWAGVYSYTTVKGANKKVNLYAINLKVAMNSVEKQGFLE